MNKFFMPPISLMGEGSLQGINSEISSRKFKKALIVTDKELVKVGLVSKLEKILQAESNDYIIFDGVQANPTVNNVNAGLKVYEENGCDYLISFGGGSPHDTAKAIGLILTNGGKIEDYEGVDVSDNPMAPLISINTTAGTASEMTVFTIITNEITHIKMAIVDKNILPVVAINDPEVMTAMPKGLTAATGLDALTHAIEAYVSTAATPITDACAQKAIELIANSLENAYNDGLNIEYRSDMAYAEYLAGMAFSNASLGHVHAMAHQLGGMYDLPHGVCNALLLPYVQRKNAKVAHVRLKEVALFMGLDVANVDSEKASELLVNHLISLANRLSIPKSLSELGVKEEDFDLLAQNATADACSFTNPIQYTKDEVIEIFRDAM